jgi:single-strand DNA-binding protein
VGSIGETMANGLNRVMLLGNLCADAELRTTSGGQAVLKLRLATNESYLDRDRQRKERVEYHSVTVWGRRAEALSRILQKGSSVFVEGSLHTSSYDDKDGNKRYRTEVVATNIIFGGSGQRRERSEQTDPGQPAQTSGGGYDDADYGGGADDNFPF